MLSVVEDSVGSNNSFLGFFFKLDTDTFIGLPRNVECCSV